jgi:hypothetical protein
MPDGSSMAGAWLGQRYFLLAVHAGQAALRPVDTGDSTPGESVPLAAAFPACPSVPYDMIALGGRLAIYRSFGGRGRPCAAPGLLPDRRSSDWRGDRAFRGEDGRYLYPRGSRSASSSSMLQRDRSSRNGPPIPTAGIWLTVL